MNTPAPVYNWPSVDVQGGGIQVKGWCFSLHRWFICHAVAEVLRRLLAICAFILALFPLLALLAQNLGWPPEGEPFWGWISTGFEIRWAIGDFCTETVPQIGAFLHYERSIGIDWHFVGVGLIFSVTFLRIPTRYLVFYTLLWPLALQRLALTITPDTVIIHGLLKTTVLSRQDDAAGRFTVTVEEPQIPRLERAAEYAASKELGLPMIDKPGIVVFRQGLARCAVFSMPRYQIAEQVVVAVLYALEQTKPAIDPMLSFSFE